MKHKDHLFKVQVRKEELREKGPSRFLLPFPFVPAPGMVASIGSPGGLLASD